MRFRVCLRGVRVGTRVREIVSRFRVRVIFSVRLRRVSVHVIVRSRRGRVLLRDHVLLRYA